MTRPQAFAVPLSEGRANKRKTTCPVELPVSRSGKVIRKELKARAKGELA